MTHALFFPLGQVLNQAFVKILSGDIIVAEELFWHAHRHFGRLVSLPGLFQHLKVMKPLGLLFNPAAFECLRG